MDLNNLSQKYLINKIQNRFGAAEGTNLAPRQSGGFRVPVVSNLQLLQTSQTSQGTSFVLTWTDPIGQNVTIDHFNIVAFGVPGAPTQPQLVGQTKLAPCTVNIPVVSQSTLQLIVQTCLSNGMYSSLEDSPSIAAQGLPVTNQVIAWSSVDQSINDSTLTSILFDTNEYAPVSSMHSTSSNTERFVAPVAGFYVAVGGIQYRANVTGQRTLYIYLNGATVLAGVQVAAATTATKIETLKPVYLNQGDYISFVGFQDSGGTRTIAGGTLDVTWGSLYQIK